jgi:cytochrome P450
MASKTYHVQVIKTDLTRKLNTLTQDVWEGLADGFEASWGNDTKNWKTVNVFQTMTQIVTRTSNRVFVGKEYSTWANLSLILLCHSPNITYCTGGNETYLKLCTSFAHDIPLSSIAIKQWPRFLRPLVGPILSLPNRYHNYKIQEILRPEILRRLQYSDDATDAPNDFLQWYISYARDSLETEELLPEILSARIATMNFAAVHTSTFTSVNAIYDIVSSPMKDSITSWITTEFEDILATADGNLAKVNVQKMACTDSILRESLRFSSGSTGALHRVVATKNGVTTPDGLHIKQGNVISIPAWPVHRDPEIYQDPDSFMPLRFLRSSVNDKEKNHEPKTRSTNTVDTSLTFLSFGHGKHGCPGRFFAAQEMKLLLAYMMTYYDIEPLETRPEPISFGSFMTPNPRVSIRVRRKE